MTLRSGKYRTENVAYRLSTCLERDYFRAKLKLTERKRCVNGKACKKRTRRLDKHKQNGSMYLYHNEGQHRKGWRLGWPLLAYSMLVIIQYIQVGDTGPERVERQNQKTWGHFAAITTTRSSDLFMAKNGLLYFVQNIVQLNLHVTWWPLAT